MNDKKKNNSDLPEYAQISKEGGEVVGERDTSNHRMTWILTGALFFVLVAFGLWYFIMKANMDTETPTDQREVEEENFQENIVSAGQLGRSGDVEAAISRFRSLVENAPTVVREGQAKLNLGVWSMESDQAAAIVLLKEVSLNELYAPFTRAKAVNYVLNQYISTYNDALAREHIFTGPVWGDFKREEEETFSQAVIRGFEYSTSLTPTPEASMRLAQEYAVRIIETEGLSQEERDQFATQALSAIEGGDSSIQTILEEGKMAYGNTDFTEIAVAYSRKGKALDVLYFQGYIDDSDRVEDAFQDGLNILLENQGGLGTELYLRYHYADFLVRLDAAERQESIRKILAPMREMQSDHDAALFFRKWIRLEDLNESKGENDLARPDNIVRLAQISPEFREALINIGIAEEELPLESSN